LAREHPEIKPAGNGFNVRILNTKELRNKMNYSFAIGFNMHFFRGVKKTI